MESIFFLVSLCALVFGTNVTSRDPSLFAFQYGNWDFTQLKMNGECANLNPSGSPYLQLTSASTNRVSGAISINKITLPNKSSFSTSFSFRMRNPGVGGADGLVFVINSQTNVVGTVGGGIGYGCVSDSIGVEFDTYKNVKGDWSCTAAIAGFPKGPGYDSNGDPNGNHVGINVNGSPQSLTTAQWPTEFADGNAHYVWVDYDGSADLLSVRLSDQNVRPFSPIITSTLDLFSILKSNDVYVGFTAATGGSYETHEILDWSFSSAYNPVDTPLTNTAQAKIHRSAGSLSFLEGKIIVGLTNNFPGQTLEIGSYTKDPTASTYFNFFDSEGNPFAKGTLYVFSQEYTGTPSGLASSSPITSTSVIDSNRWVIDSSVSFTPGAKYFFYVNTAITASLAAAKDVGSATYSISGSAPSPYVGDPKYGFSYDLAFLSTSTAFTISFKNDFVGTIIIPEHHADSGLTFKLSSSDRNRYDGRTLYITRNYQYRSNPARVRCLPYKIYAKQTTTDGVSWTFPSSVKFDFDSWTYYFYVEPLNYSCSL